MPKGAKYGGRTKGTANKVTQGVAEKLERLGCDPITGLATIAGGDLPCNVCRGEGKTKFQPARGLTKLATRTCESCYGSGKEKVSPGERLKAYSDLASYVYPKRKAVEHTGLDGGPIQHAMRVTFVKSPNAKPSD